MSTTKKILQDLIKEALENNGEDSILLKRPELLKEEEGVLRSTFLEKKPSEEVKDILNRVEKLSPAELKELYGKLQEIYLDSMDKGQTK